MALTDSDVKQAEARMQARRKTSLKAVSARYDRRAGRVLVELDGGWMVAFPARLAEGLDKARAGDLADIEITPSGMGLHFPKLDADLYLPALLAGVLGSQRWMAGLMGQVGGQSKSPAKAAASRNNGRLGGRPRKPVAA
jgi:hypothetical protein